MSHDRALLTCKLRCFDVTKKIFVTPTSNGLLQLFRTAAAGTMSFVLDAWLLYVIAVKIGLHYLIAAPISFAVSFFFNFYLVREFVFPKCKKTFAAELLSYSWITLISLGLTELCMFAFIEYLGVYLILSKFMSAIVVMLWSFAARKYWIYRQ
ncbi:MAG: GtrA family protein [Synergistaceae bacterium]|jgi:putative flippase GtrA|nr:GtrA family protein [Synergistaceae bacterium]